MPSDLASAALQWVGTPFIGGCSPAVRGRGADCASFLAAVLAECGYLPSARIAPYDWCAPWARGDARYVESLAALGPEVSVPLPGDIALFWAGRGWSHAGLVLDYPRIIHAHRHFGVSVASATEGFLRGRRARFFRPGGRS